MKLVKKKKRARERKERKERNQAREEGKWKGGQGRGGERELIL